MSGQVSESKPAIQSQIKVDLPQTYNGWHRLERDNVDLEYWRSGSTHVSGAYEQLAVTQASDGTYTLSETVYDRFNHTVSSKQLIRGQKPENAGFLWSRLKKRMDEFGGGPDFDGPPALPETVGEWELAERRYEGDNRDAVRWKNEYAAVVVEEVKIKDLYCRTKRKFTVRYETENQNENLVKKVPRTAAFEIAVFIMEHLKSPAKALEHQRARLTDLVDIGPQRSLRLLRLGVLDEDDLAKNIDGTHPCNYHHTEAVQKIVTDRLESAL
jgi:hypothetical protein